MTREEAIEHLNTIGIYYSQDHSDPYGKCARLTKDELDAICLAIKALEQKPCTNIPYLMHREMDIPISECQKAYDVAIEYLRSKAKMKG